jgi:hypothetical protein
MDVSDYEKILHHLEAATAVVLRHQGELRENDIRLRHLLSITTMEAKRGARGDHFGVPSHAAAADTSE